MTTSKTQETKIILTGDPILLELEAGEALLPGLLLLEVGDGTVDGATDAVAWRGGIALEMGELGQGYSGVFATDSAAANLYAIGDPVRYAVVDQGNNFHGWLKASGTDIAAGDSLEVIDEGTYKGCVQKLNAGVAVAVALEAIAISGIALNTPIQARRI